MDHWSVSSMNWYMAGCFGVAGLCFGVLVTLFAIYGLGKWAETRDYMPGPFKRE